MYFPTYMYLEMCPGFLDWDYLCKRGLIWESLIEIKCLKYTVLNSIKQEMQTI